MNIDSFFAHYNIEQNPFAAEEARLDPIFDRLEGKRLTHPDFSKIMGNPDQPGTAIVFGEKGSGKTAIRLMIGHRIEQHNLEHPDRRVLLVEYDDLNPVLDQLLRSRKQKAEAVLKHFRLEDHQDAILSRAMTKLVGSILGEQVPGERAAPLPDDLDRVLKKLPRQDRGDLAVLAALYDQPRTGSVVDRWHRLRSKLRLGWRLPIAAVRVLAIILTLAALGLIAFWFYTKSPSQPLWIVVVMAMTIAAAVLSWGYWAWRHTSLWWLCRRIRREMPAVNRSVGELRQMLGDLSAKQLARQPLPVNGQSQPTGDARYQITRRLVDLLHPLGYVGMFVLVDRVDEPTLINSDPDKMRSLIWPMLDNKFLQQKGVGVKLLLPVELRHMLRKESAAFFQEARLDKQNMIDRLTWSGATLYDLCSMRLRVCRPADAEPINLTDLFEEDVAREMLVDALDQMHQPRDAFKFLYQVIQEHCRLAPEDTANYKIARLTLESVRRDQSQRVQEFYRGLTPA